MNPATRPTDIDQPSAHLRLVSDRAGGAASGITLSGVSKTYRSRDGDVPSLRPLDFHINEGEFFVVVGPSGCGKSTLLKMISGLLAPSTGEILVEGEQVTKPHGNVGIVFQNALLLPWRNILSNVMLPIDMPLAIEPLHPAYAADRACVNTTKQALDICDQLDPQRTGALGVALDVYHIWWDPELMAQIARAGKDRLLAFHEQVALNLRRLVGQPPSDFDSRSYTERALQQFNAEDPADATLGNVKRMEQLIQEMEQRGARVLLFELPYSEPIEGSQFTKTTREIVHSAFPDPRRWLNIDVNRNELRWADGVHLDERSAIVVAQAIERALASVRAVN